MWANGLPADVRRLRPGDAEALASHLLRLSPEDRRLRFCSTVSDDFVHSLCQRIDWHDHVLLGCFVGGELRAVSEMVPLPDKPRTVEIALTVEREYQNHGIGSELLRRIVVLARNRFTHTIYMTCLPENRKTRRVAQKLGAQLVVRSDEAEGYLRAPWPSCLTLAEERVSDGLAIFRAAFAPALPAATGKAGALEKA